MISKQTTLDLNGPILSFTSNPVSVSVCNAGIATFIGIATATFPTTASNTGYISYQWYDGNGALSNGTNVTGSATTTLTVSNLTSPTDNDRQFYLKADYIASAYGLTGVAVTVGSGRSTGNAINDALNSSSASLTVFPVLSVTTQPTEQTVSQTKTATFTTLGALTDTTQGSISYQWQLNGSDLSNSSTVTGSTTTSLSVSLPNVGVNTVRAKLFHPTACNSSIFTNTVNFNVVDPRQILNVELLPANPGYATLYSWNLFTQGSLSAGAGDIPTSSAMCFYAPEKPIDVFLDIIANSGTDNGGYRGGQGGSSTIKLTLQQNVEYIIMSISQVNSGGSIFIYKKSGLIAVVGGGGNAGNSGNGGDGGGVNVGGASGFGRGAGSGGTLFTPGTLPSTGIFGSTVNNSGILKSGDGQASAPSGGRVLPCPRGDYWYNLGYSACQDMGNVQFATQPGNIIPNSTSSIIRGFKAGYGIRNTAGAGTGGGGNGGNGATGGNGGTDGGGGGGGSGYSDGSIQIISTRQGGNFGTGRVTIRSVS